METVLWGLVSIGGYVGAVLLFMGGLRGLGASEDGRGICCELFSPWSGNYSRGMTGLAAAVFGTLYGVLTILPLPCLVVGVVIEAFSTTFGRHSFFGGEDANGFVVLGCYVALAIALMSWSFSIIKPLFATEEMGLGDSYESETHLYPTEEDRQTTVDIQSLIDASRPFSDQPCLLDGPGRPPHREKRSPDGNTKNYRTE